MFIILDKKPCSIYAMVLLDRSSVISCDIVSQYPFPTFSQIPEVTLAPVSEQPVQGPPSDEVTDLRQRLAILQQKRADDKTRIKELEKYKAQLMQVSCASVCVCERERERGRERGREGGREGGRE